MCFAVCVLPLESLINKVSLSEMLMTSLWEGTVHVSVGVCVSKKEKMFSGPFSVLE